MRSIPVSRLMCYLSYLLLACLAVLAGCSDTKITVVDDTGMPVAGARVAVQTMSTQGAVASTGTDGGARVSTRIMGARWIAVSKPGFQTEIVALPTNGPVRVVLRHT